MIAQHMGPTGDPLCRRSFTIARGHRIERFGDQCGNDGLVERLGLHQRILEMLAKPLVCI